MATLVLGNSASYDGVTNNAAGLAAALGSNYASASSGALTLNGVSFDNSSTTLVVRRKGASDLAAKGGATISSNTQGPVEITSADAGVFGTEVVVNSGVYLWSDASTPALTISVPNTIIKNYGYIIGKGGSGGNGAGGAPSVGYNALLLQADGCTVTNYSGAYIAGGGGGGGGGWRGAGGGGAGGGKGGNGGGWGSGGSGVGGNGGAIGASGANGQRLQASKNAEGSGGGSGGGGATGEDNGSSQGYMDGAGGGGRILPGVGGDGGGWRAADTGGDGGTANAVGVNGAAQYGSEDGGGGGGGWGAAGGNGAGGAAGASGGAAISASGYSYTLVNSGTIYGAT